MLLPLRLRRKIAKEKRPGRVHIHMLILSRRKGQSVVIGGDITVTVTEIRGKTVKLSVDTPKGITVFREEIYRDIEKENRKALSSPVVGDLPNGRLVVRNKANDTEVDP